jgi:hypothetical protein
VKNLERAFLIFDGYTSDLFHMNFISRNSENTKFTSSWFEVLVFIELNNGYTTLIYNVSYNQII